MFFLLVGKIYQSAYASPLALLRSRLSAHLTFQISDSEPDMVKVSRALLQPFNDLLTFAT
jgi:hypothetical protein